jgi:hypothetical protein
MACSCSTTRACESCSSSQGNCSSSSRQGTCSVSGGAVGGKQTCQPLSTADCSTACSKRILSTAGAR